MKCFHFNHLCYLIASGILLSLSACKHAEISSFKDYIDSANMDLSLSPGDDFFNYANGTWLKQHTIPESEVLWGDAKISEKNNIKKIKTMLEGLASGSPTERMEKMVSDMYRSGMDTTLINQLGIKPIQGDIARITAIKTSSDVVTEIALEQTLGLAPALNIDIYADKKNSNKLVAYFSQGGLGLPEKGYYFDNDADTKKIRNAYAIYISKVLVLTGENLADANKAAQSILALETTLAGASRSPVELRNVDSNYHKYSIKGISADIPGMQWPALMNWLKMTQDTIVVEQPRFFKELSTQLAKTDVNTWKNYLKFHFVDAVAIYLNKELVSGHYEFADKTLNGQALPLQRWDQVSRVIDNLMGDPLGYTYVKKYFLPATKARMDTLVQNIEAAFEERIKKLDWMTDSTKEKAIAKLHHVIYKIGYPDKWRQYESVTIDPGKYYANAMACKAYLYRETIDYLKSGKVDRKRWGMTPPTVDAEYFPTANAMEFPAGYLQYPFFALDADDAVNYGGVGLMIGHELTHGFDDQGRQYDENGTLKNWWTAADENRFKEKAKQIVNLYNSYVVLDSLHVNGSLTQGENIADFGGLAISFDAFKKTAQYKAGNKINGFTPQQRFFLSFAQCRRRKMRDENLRTFIKTDPHAPSWFRIIGPYSNFTAFHEAYNLKPGQKMYRPVNDRITIW
jgi:putative endopeptidase